VCGADHGSTSAPLYGHNSSKGANRARLGARRSKVEDLGGSNPPDLPLCFAKAPQAATTGSVRSENRHSKRTSARRPAAVMNRVLTLQLDIAPDKA
jgi:hypothetical protein